LLVILFERDTAYPPVFTAGRPLPGNPQPAFNVAARRLNIAVVRQWTHGN
jgi:hypothetical protein